MLNSYEAIYDHGQIEWVDQPPPLEKAHVIITVLPAANETDMAVVHRRPSPKNAGKGMIVGDIMSPVVPAEDWDALR